MVQGGAVMRKAIAIALILMQLSGVGFIKVVRSEKLTARCLEHRQNKYIVVEVVKGKCLNNKGDGKTSDGYYISYKRVKGHKRGAKYTTYCVYANNNYVDDVAFRIDVKRK